MQETADTDLLPLQLIEPYDINYKYILKNKNQQREFKKHKWLKYNDKQYILIYSFYNK